MKKSSSFNFVPEAVQGKSTGFTLIELLVAIVIIGVLLAIAVPQYTQTVLKAHRTDAKAALLDLAQREEKYYSTKNTYSSTMSDLYSGASGTSLSIQSGSTSYYTLTIPTVTAASSASGTAAYFQAQAAPTGTQANDICGTFTIDSTGTTGVTGGTVTTGCW